MHIVAFSPDRVKHTHFRDAELNQIVVWSHLQLLSIELVDLLHTHSLPSIVRSVGRCS